MRKLFLLAIVGVPALMFSTACQSAPAKSPSPTIPRATTTTQPTVIAQPSVPAPAPITWKADGKIVQGEYQNSRVFNNFELYWSSDDQFVYFAMKAKTGGWIAIGFDPVSLMKNSDIIEGYVSDGKVTVLDMYSTGDFGPHPPDIQLGGTNDIIESGGTEEDGYTVIEFKRKIDTGDKFDKVLGKGTHKIIWAVGPDDQATIRHSVRGTGEIDL